MEGTSLKLRDVTASDLPIFFAQQQDSIACQQAAFPARDRGAFDQHWARILQNTVGFIRTIVWNGEVAGNVVSFNRADEREVGYWLGREYWGLGVATRALQELLVIEKHRPLFAGVVDDNAGSIRVLEKCGFQLLRSERSHSLARGADIAELIFELKT